MQDLDILEKALIRADFLERLDKAVKGEGSKGGKIIGHTKLGRPIYDSHSHEKHQGFSQKEHQDAAHAHMSHIKNLEEQDKAKHPTMQHKPGKVVSKETHKEIAHHAEQYLKHIKEAGHINKSEADLIDLEKGAGEGSRGGHVRGHTRTGKPIYGDFHSTTTHRSYMPAGGLEPHYADEQELKVYKHIARRLKLEGHSHEGNITFDPVKKQIKAVTPEGKKHLKRIVDEARAKAAGGKAPEATKPGEK